MLSLLTINLGPRQGIKEHASQSKKGNMGM